MAEATHPARRTSSDASERLCWICLGSDIEQPQRAWSQPCKCKSSLRWVHETCLLAWVQEKSGPRVGKPIVCAACAHPYTIEQADSRVLTVLSSVDVAYRIYLHVVGLAGLGIAVTIVSTTYGAFVVHLVCGPVEGRRILLGHWSWRMWFGLSMIPLSLILSRSSTPVSLLPLLPVLATGNRDVLRLPSPELTLSLLPCLHILYGAVYDSVKSMILTNDQKPRLPVIPAEPPEGGEEDMVINGVADNDGNNLVDGVFGEMGEGRSMPRQCVGALLFPVVASYCGSFLGRFTIIRKYVPNFFHRTILGGGLLLVIKDASDLCKCTMDAVYPTRFI
ncbi:hypothetical protein SeMB42_g03824 [Synchytrium endobioticum]|uniref:RING-CH-type domain-containing protein n=1 Tax=Synchytrium endobioticum TaxID=286115 RepID=A0A507D3T1_9FUNG|nr:hypothetical protein SeMB42_g03824 [Synchytrium endobioticum]